MPTAPAARTKTEDEGDETKKRERGLLFRLARRPATREILIILAFCLLTALLTWPYVTRLRDAVVGHGDPYLIAWSLWWDYHATFNDPLNLFHANILYPYRYTLAFSEHSYGVALPFFPLFALGARPLTVHAVAMFFGFAFSGYGAFRLARTLTGSYGAAWVAGIIFAFVPYRFGLMAQLMYLSSPWIPLLFEALVLFTRERSRRRAVWLGVAFFMTGLSTITWLLLSLLPLAVSAAILLTRHGLWREREFWRRGAVALGAASAALLPFTAPYYIVSKMYGYRRRIDDVQAHSGRAISWLVSGGPNNLWRGLGAKLPDGDKFQFFPGLLPLLLALAALLGGGPLKSRVAVADDESLARDRWIKRLDAVAFVAFALSIPAIGYDGTEAFRGLFYYLTSERVLTVLCVAVLTRLCLAYPDFLRRESANLIETIRSARRGDAFWIGVVLSVLGFCYSLGWNFFLYRIHYDLLLPFKSIRAPMRAAILACLGLALLAGLGAGRLAEAVKRRRPRVRRATVYACVCVLLLAELNAAPLYFIRGEVYPDAVTLRLKETQMHGGIVELPAGLDFNTRYMLRAADHAKPLVNATSGFIPPHVDDIESLTRAGAITPRFMELLEKIPASYLVINNQLIAPERRPDFTAFFAWAVASGRLRFVNRFDGSADLYAVVKTEPDAKGEAALPFGLSIQEWAAQIEDDPVSLLGQHLEWSQSLFRLHVAAFGSMPRYADFMRDARSLGRGVLPGFDEQDRKLEGNLRALAEEWTGRPAFKELYDPLNDAQYVDRLLNNAGVDIGAADRAALSAALASREETRAGVLLKVVADSRFVTKEQNRSLVALHYFGYLQRNPGDPPDRGLEGFDFWIKELETLHGPAKISAAFKASGEYGELKRAREK